MDGWWPILCCMCRVNGWRVSVIPYIVGCPIGRPGSGGIDMRAGMVCNAGCRCVGRWLSAGLNGMVKDTPLIERPGRDGRRLPVNRGGLF